MAPQRETDRRAKHYPVLTTRATFIVVGRIRKRPSLCDDDNESVELRKLDAAKTATSIPLAD
jgi:hypothetical protein